MYKLIAFWLSWGQAPCCDSLSRLGEWCCCCCDHSPMRIPFPACSGWRRGSSPGGRVPAPDRPGRCGVGVCHYTSICCPAICRSPHLRGWKQQMEGWEGWLVGFMVWGDGVVFVSSKYYRDAILLTC